MSVRTTLLPLALLAVSALATAAHAQIAAVAIDNKMVNEDGVTKPVTNPAPDSVIFFDTSATPPKELGRIEAPTSAGGPPSTVAISKDESLAIVTGGPADTVTLVDLSGGKPNVADSIKAGKAPAGVSFTPDGKTALVANRGDGTVSVISISGKKLKLIGTVTVGDAESQPSHAAITPDGKMALVTLQGEYGVAILDINGQTVTLRDQDLLTPGVRPYGLDITPNGKLAVVGNMGRTVGDVDTVALVDLTADPVRVVNIVPVGVEPEAVIFSPDGKYLAVGMQNGSQFPKDAWFYNDGGKLSLYAVDGHDLKKLDDTRIGHWTQGVVFSPDGKEIYVQSMLERDIQVFDWNGKRLKDTASIST
jgi:DNA-binding beta-propeller fold protein YncE